MGNKQGYLLPVVIDPEEYVCVIIKAPKDDNHLAALWGQLTELGYWQTWERDPDHLGTQAAQVWRNVYYTTRELYDSTGGACVFCCDDELDLLRELLECCSRQQQSVNVTLLSFRTDTVNNYWSDPSSIHYDAPDTDFDSSSGDTPEQAAQRTAALCFAITQYVDSLIQQSRQRAVGLGLVAAGAALIVNPFAAALVAMVTDAALIGFDAGVWSNEEAIQKVRCCMYDSLAGAALSYANFVASVDDCGFTPLSAESQLAYIVNVSNVDRANFLEFVRLLGTGMTAGVAGDDCTCGPEPIECNSGTSIGTIIVNTTDTSPSVTVVGADFTYPSGFAPYEAGDYWIYDHGSETYWFRLFGQVATLSEVWFEVYLDDILQDTAYLPNTNGQATENIQFPLYGYPGRYIKLRVASGTLLMFQFGPEECDEA